MKTSICLTALAKSLCGGALVWSAFRDNFGRFLKSYGFCDPNDLERRLALYGTRSPITPLEGGKGVSANPGGTDDNGGN